MSARLDPLACAAFLVSAFVLAGLCQAVWLASASSWRFGAPIDAGRTFRGRRLLGDNKTWRGLVVMVPATSLSFALVAVLAQETAVGIMLWPVPASAYAAAGLLAGLGFMAGELPNSFIKRQLNIPAGQAARGPIIRPVFFVADRIDSALGMMLALSLVLPIPATTWLWILLVGPALHGLFSLFVFRLGGKARAA
jgi:hypothetical protein